MSDEELGGGGNGTLHVLPGAGEGPARRDHQVVQEYLEDPVRRSTVRMGILVGDLIADIDVEFTILLLAKQLGELVGKLGGVPSVRDTLYNAALEEFTESAGYEMDEGEE